MQGGKRLFTNYIKRKLKKEGARMCARRLPTNPLREDFRREGVCAGEPSGFPCAFNKGWIPNFLQKFGQTVDKPICRGRRPRRPACKCSEFAESHRKTPGLTAGASRTPPPTISNFDFFDTLDTRRKRRVFQRVSKDIRSRGFEIPNFSMHIPSRVL